MLKIRIHDDHGFSLRGVEPGRDCDFLAEIARKRKRPHARFRGVEPPDLCEAAIPAAVVDEEDFPCSRLAFEDRGEARDERAKVLRFVEDGNDDGQLEGISRVVHGPIMTDSLEDFEGDTRATLLSSPMEAR